MMWRVAWALLLVASAGLAQPVQAQGFFQYFFGPDPPRRVYPGPAPFSPYQFYGNGYDQERPPTYRTLCVRLCDGYYFPISFSTTRSEFSRDADKCTASCGSEVRLFYHANPGGDVEGMTDLTGMGYAALPNAFKYRKSLVDNCSCRPQPWSEAELERHRSYATSQRPAASAAHRGDSGKSRRGNGNAQGTPFSSKPGSPAGLFR